MVSAARSRRTGQLNGDRVAVPLLFLPLATTSLPTTTLYTMEQPLKWHTKLPHATNEDEDGDAYRMMTMTEGMGRGLEKWHTSVETPLWPDARPSSRHPPKTMYSASYSTADDAMTGASIADTTMDLTHPTTPVRSNYRARRCRPPPRPSSPSPTSPRTSRAPTFGHLPLFEWGNIAVRLVFPIDPTVTRRPPTTLPPALDDIPPALQGSPLPRNLTTPVFDNGECNLNAVAPSSNPTPRHYRRPRAGYDPHYLQRPLHHAQPFQLSWYIVSSGIVEALSLIMLLRTKMGNPLLVHRIQLFLVPDGRGRRAQYGSVLCTPVERAGQREFRLQ
ncbi:hypothetical protein EDD18DRAFT_1108402 [Armillaria luteobubalina]|uniref:Uncharacterized protein n=1 Tax=Armillaria luteobubalina TaxID=153913 RepID=A0AA39UUC3_9AGAR|nr:hypothetical protein EDD18DRAFT_1108402 [Armillaria luteobubalina]